MHRNYQVEDVEGLALADAHGDLVALATWARIPQGVELVSLDALESGHGHGSQVLEAAEETLASQRIPKITLVTTNDNVRAFGFYLRRGYRLVQIHPNSMDRVRKLKPQVPQTGEHGIPLTDMWELEKILKAC